MENTRLVYRMLSWLLVWVTHVGAHELATVAPPAPRIHFRQPVALVISGDRLFVANRRGGSLSRIDTRTWDVLSEKLIGRSLSDLAVLGDDRLLAIDEVAGEVVVLREHTGQVWIDQQIDVATSPVSVVISRDTGIASVASLWGWRMR